MPTHSSNSGGGGGSAAARRRRQPSRRGLPRAAVAVATAVAARCGLRRMPTGDQK